MLFLSNDCAKSPTKMLQPPLPHVSTLRLGFMNEFSLNGTHSSHDTIATQNLMCNRRIIYLEVYSHLCHGGQRVREQGRFCNLCCEDINAYIVKVYHREHLKSNLKVALYRGNAKRAYVHTFPSKSGLYGKRPQRRLGAWTYVLFALPLQYIICI